MTIKKIAELAGVSPATVSRVINNSGYVKDEVRKRVQEILDETGYRPNAFAKALQQKRSNTIGVILPKINSSSSSDLVMGIDEYISKKGYTLLIGNTNHSTEKELHFLRLFQEKMVDGIIIVATIITKEHKDFIKKSNIPVVIVGQESTGSTPYVTFDDILAAKDITRHLIESGRKKIAFIGVEDSDISVGRKRKKGYIDGLNESNIPIVEEYITKGSFTVESGYEACKEIFTNLKDSTDKPDAIFAVTDKMAIGAASYLLELGVSIPKDIAICGIGGGVFSKYFTPSLTTAYYDFKSSGSECAKLLLGIISKESATSKNIIMNHKLIIRESSFKES